MPFALHLSFPIFTYDSVPKLTITPRIQVSCTSSDQSHCSNQESEDDSESRSDSSKHQVVLVERYMNGTSKRYILDDKFQLTTYLEDDSKSKGFFSKELPWLPDLVKDFVLPAGFPGSVSDDYLEYMLLQFPTNVTAWICHTLVTSSLLKAGCWFGLFFWNYSCSFCCCHQMGVKRWNWCCWAFFHWRTIWKSF
ncbi:hypothetical protein R6Q59_018329 [Mikania micrantha]